MIFIDVEMIDVLKLVMFDVVDKVIDGKFGFGLLVFI